MRCGAGTGRWDSDGALVSVEGGGSRCGRGIRLHGSRNLQVRGSDKAQWGDESRLPSQPVHACACVCPAASRAREPTVWRCFFRRGRA